MDFAARAGDCHQCPEREGDQPHRGGALQGGSDDVFINGEPAICAGDEAECEVGGPDTIAEGAAGVFINGRAAARVGDATEHGGVITAGSSDVVMGGESMTAHTASALDVEKSLRAINYHDDSSLVLSFDLQYSEKTISPERTRNLNTHFSTTLTTTVLTEQPWQTKKANHSALHAKHYYSRDVEQTSYQLESLLSQDEPISTLEENNWNDALTLYYKPWNNYLTSGDRTL